MVSLNPVGKTAAILLIMDTMDGDTSTSERSCGLDHTAAAATQDHSDTNRVQI